VPCDIWRSTRAQRDFNHIEADTDERLSKLATPLEKEK
jgi:hypothetical protein